ncbi:universal stress protein [Arvimicrobium flavum]|uniref:universal stress protein n=1 Tax=Arvimicrobium flavum TaxID=3393320 RepID=UPI00237A4F27|nr:universal stress protein [Mesorhizobium shangrilense]
MKPRALLPLATYPDASADTVPGYAISVAKQLDADVHALALVADIPDVANALSRVLLKLPEMIREAEATSAKRAAHLLDAVKREAAASGVTATTGEIRGETALLADEAAVNARYFDLSIIGLEAGNDTSRMIAEAVVFGSGRPTLLLPEQRKTGAIEHVAIAWDGTRVAARAVADARMFLARANQITVLTILDEKPLNEKNAGERLAQDLQSRGLPAKAASIHAEDCPIAETLQRKAVELGCDLLVMGGYGHSRLRDFVLGGATEGVLGDLRLPTLMAH